MVSSLRKIKVLDLSDSTAQQIEVDFTSYDQFLKTIAAKLGYLSYSADTQVFIFTENAEEIHNTNYNGVKQLTRLYYVNPKCRTLLETKVSLHPQINNPDREYDEDFHQQLKDGTMRNSLKIDEKNFPVPCKAVLTKIKSLFLRVFKSFREKNTATLINKHLEYEKKLNTLIQAFERASTEELSKCHSSTKGDFEKQKKFVLDIKVLDADQYTLPFLSTLHKDYLSSALEKLKSLSNSQDIETVYKQFEKDFQYVIADDDSILLNYLSDNVTKIHEKAMGYLRMKEILANKFVPQIPVANAYRNTSPSEIYSGINSNHNTQENNRIVTHNNQQIFGTDEPDKLPPYYKGETIGFVDAGYGTGKTTGNVVRRNNPSDYSIQRGEETANILAVAQKEKDQIINQYKVKEEEDLGIIKSLEEKLKQREQKEDSLQRESIKLELQLETKDKEIQDLKSNSEANSRKIESLRQELETSRLNQQRQQVVIENYLQKIKETEEEKDNLENELMSKRDEIKQITDALAGMTNEVENYEHQSANHEAREKEMKKKNPIFYSRNLICMMDIFQSILRKLLKKSCHYSMRSMNQTSQSYPS